jgi:hypothetical protein
MSCSVDAFWKEEGKEWRVESDEVTGDFIFFVDMIIVWDGSN